MIDPNSETLISLADAAKSLPRRRGGKKVHLSCAYRWTNTGCRGVILESIQIGGTTRPWGGVVVNASGSAPESPRSPARRRRAAEKAERELERQGA